MHRSIFKYITVLIMLFVLFNIGLVYPEDSCDNAVIIFNTGLRINISDDMKVKQWFHYDYSEELSCYANGLCNVRSDRKWKFGYIDVQYREVIPFVYDYVYPFLFNRAIVKSNEEGWAVLDGQAKQIVPFGMYSRIFPYSDGLAQVFSGGKTGYIDLNGELAIPLDYLPLDESLEQASEVGRFREGLAAVKTVDEKCVFIDKQNSVIIRDIFPLSAFYSGLALAHVGGDMVFIDRRGVNPFGRAFAEAAEFREGLAYVKNRDGTRGFIDKRGKTVIQLPDTDQAFGRTFRGFHNGFCVVERVSGGENLYYLCTPNGAIFHDLLFRQISCVRNGNAVFIKNDGRMGTLSGDGSLHYGIFGAWSSESLSEMYWTRYGEHGHWWFYEPPADDDEPDIRTQIFRMTSSCFRLKDFLDGLPKPTEGYLLSAYCNGLAICCKYNPEFVGKPHGYVNEDGKECIPFEYSEAKPFSEGLAAVCKVANGEDFSSRRWEYIDTKGRQIIPRLFSYAGPFLNGRAVVEIAVSVGDDEISYSDGKKHERKHFAVIDRYGKILFASNNRIVPSPNGSYAIIQFDFSNPLKPQLKASWFVDERGERLNKEDFLMVRPLNDFRAFIKYPKDERFSLIDSDFNVIAREICDDARIFSEGYCAVKIGVLWGYCDASGRIVISPQFQEAFDFEGGFARISIGKGLTAFMNLIDKTGKRVINSDAVFHIFHGTLSDLVPNEMFSTEPIRTP